MPVLLFPMATTFSRRSTYSYQASWMTGCLFTDGMARKSKVSYQLEAPAHCPAVFRLFARILFARIERAWHGPARRTTDEW